jgi:hypothetical protein
VGGVPAESAAGRGSDGAAPFRRNSLPMRGGVVLNARGTRAHSGTLAYRDSLMRQSFDEKRRRPWRWLASLPHHSLAPSFVFWHSFLITVRVTCSVAQNQTEGRS